MNRVLWLSLCVATVVPASAPADEPTAADLAQHLQIASWVSKVDLPAGSFNVSVHHVVDGKIVETLAGGVTGPGDDPTGQRVVVMYSPVNGGGRVTLLIGQTRVTSRSAPDVPLTGSVGLPSNLSEGDYCLGGKYRQVGGTIVLSGSRVESLEDGLLLRVTKN